MNTTLASLRNLEISLSVRVCADGLKASAFAIGMMYAFKHVGAELEYHMGDAYITAGSTTYRLMGKHWHQQKGHSFIVVHPAIAQGLDLYHQALNQGFIDLSYTKADIASITKAFELTITQYS